jgi:hypothetical protein
MHYNLFMRTIIINPAVIHNSNIWCFKAIYPVGSVWRIEQAGTFFLVSWLYYENQVYDFALTETRLKFLSTKRTVSIKLNTKITLLKNGRPSDRQWNRYIKRQLDKLILFAVKIYWYLHHQLHYFHCLIFIISVNRPHYSLVFISVIARCNFLNALKREEVNSFETLVTKSIYKDTCRYYQENERQ